MDNPNMSIASTNSTSLRPIISDQTYTSVALYMIIVGSMSVILNSIAAYVLIAKLKFSSPQSHILVSLTLGDALCNAISVPLTVYANFAKGWTLGQNACAFYGFATFSAGLSSIYHLLLLSTERFVAVVHPFQSETLLRPGQINRSIALAWILSVAVASLPLFGWSSYKLEGIGTSCSVDLFPNSLNSISYTIFILAIGYVVPMGIIVFLNARFLKEVNKLTETKGSYRTNAIGFQANANLVKEDKRLRRQMGFLVCSLIASFNLAWFPYAVTVMYGLAKGAPFDNALISSIPSYFAKSYSVYDPIIYFLLDKKFRSSLFQCLGRGGKSNRVVDPKERTKNHIATLQELEKNTFELKTRGIGEDNRRR